MTGQEYRMHMDVLAASLRILLLVPIDELLEVVSRADTLGPVLEPTAMRDGFDRLGEQRQILEAAQALRNTILRLWPAEAAELAARTGAGG